MQASKWNQSELGNEMLLELIEGLIILVMPLRGGEAMIASYFTGVVTKTVMQVP